MKTKEVGEEEVIHSLAKTSGKDEEEEEEEEGERVITIPPREEVEREKEGERERGVGGADERWSNGALSNLSEIGRAIESLQKLLLGNAVYMDEEAFAHASHNANLTRRIMAQERRIKVLERELDAAIASAGIARAEKRSAEVAQRAAETRTQEVLQELENTTQVFKLHMEELRSKQEELRKKDEEIKVLQAITETLSQGSNKGRNLLAANFTHGSLRKDATS